MEKNNYATLQKMVINQGLCTGCGLCAGVCPNGVWKMAWPGGDAEPLPAGENCRQCGICSAVCPGRDIPLLDLEQLVFGKSRDPVRDEEGVYQGAFAAHAVRPEIRAAGASGGVATAMLAYALDVGLIDGAVVAGFNPDRPYLAEGAIVTQSRDLPRHARSKYGGNPPVNAVLSEAVLGRGLTSLGLIGCPCHVHGLRKLQRLGRPKKVAQSVRLVLGLFCASQLHFEGTRHLLAEYCGVRSLDEIEAMDYRWGDWPGRFYVRTKAGREVLVDRHEYVYHHLFFGWQRDRCTVCLDHCAELADLAFGDYWTGETKPGEPGRTMVIARSGLGLELLEEAEKKGYVAAREIDLEQTPPAGAQLKKRRNPFLHRVRAGRGMPVPDFGFTPGHEPGPARIFQRAPSFDGPVVVVKEPGRAGRKKG